MNVAQSPILPSSAVNGSVQHGQRAPDRGARESHVEGADPHPRTTSSSERAAANGPAAGSTSSSDQGSSRNDSDCAVQGPDSFPNSAATGLHTRVDQTVAAGANSEDGQIDQGSLPSVKALPPLHLRLTFPKSYPSARPPAAHISAAWLAPQQAQHLQDQLLELWNQQGPGLPICFTWLDWLQACTLEHLGISDNLSLAPVAAAHTGHAATCHLSSLNGSLTQEHLADIHTRNRATSQQNGFQDAPVSSAAPPAAAWRAVDGQSAGDVYAAADQLLGHLLRYDAMLDWDR